MSRLAPRILVIDDDPGLLKLVSRDLKMEGYGVITAGDGKAGLQIIQDEKLDLVLLDIMMPGMDGFQVCQSVREFSDMPVIMLTARGQTEDVTHGLDLGADDYIKKPFRTTELVARVKAVLRRFRFPEEIPQPPFILGGLRIDFSSHVVSVDGEEVLLTPTDYRLLCLLVRNAGRVMTQDQLLTEIWGWEYIGETHLLQVAMNRLRKKIGDQIPNSRYIVTRPGIGYVFKEPARNSD